MVPSLIILRHPTLNQPIMCNTSLQYFRGFSFAKDAVCWSLQPDRKGRLAAMKYFVETALQNDTSFLNEDTSLVIAHVRRGDYAGKNKMHGFLSEGYYSASWKMLQAQVSLEGKKAGQNLVVVVFAMSGDMQWSKEHLANKFPGAKRVIFADPHQRGRGPSADIDMLAMSLGSYFILANSTFSWWAAFFSDCRRRFGRRWWPESLPWKQRQYHRDTRPLATLPHRWHVGRDTRFPETWQYMQSRYLVPGLFPLYENEDAIAARNAKN